MRKLDEFGQLALKRAVDSLFTKRHFDICLFDDIEGMLGVKANPVIRRQLRVYHCVDFGDMTDQEKVLIQQKVVEALRGEQIFNPALVLSQLTTEGNDFTFTEDRYIDAKALPGKTEKKSNVLGFLGKK